MAIVAIAAIFFGVPLVKEGTSGDCAALSSRVFTPAASASRADQDASGMMSLFAGTLVEAMVTMRYPNIPSGISCAALYWRTLYDPGYADQLRQ